MRETQFYINGRWIGGDKRFEVISPVTDGVIGQVAEGTHAIGFIGSIETGHKVAARAASKEPLLEMCANSPLIVLEDADLILHEN